jgi:hypothetical protein
MAAVSSNASREVKGSIASAAVAQVSGSKLADVGCFSVFFFTSASNSSDSPMGSVKRVFAM